MIVNAANQKLLNCNVGDEIVVMNQEKYYAGPRASILKEYPVRDIIKDNGKLVILI